MKTLYTLLCLTLGLAFNGTAQTPCDDGRYSTDVFSSADVTSNITYGQNIGFTGSNTVLKLDIYEPSGDTMSARPLIVWAHGGSFIGGSKTDSDVVTLSQEFAKKGYVCVSIDYRTGMWPIDSTNAIKAMLRATQDMKAAVRYFYQDRATTNTYKIDTTKIFVGGSSAGAIMAAHYAYLDKECEAEDYISLTTLNSMGGLEGTSGNPGYSTDVIGAINLCGALARYGYMEAGDIPLCSTHGNNDGTVPYAHGVASVSGFNVLYLDGSRMIEEQANTVGVTHNFYTYYNKDHVPYAGNAATMDTTVNFVRDFLIETMGCTEAALQTENTPVGTPVMYQQTHCGLSIDEKELTFAVYPVPSSDKVNITWEGSEIDALKVFDLSGKVIQETKIESSLNSLTISDLQQGVYFISLYSNGVRLALGKSIIE